MLRLESEVRAYSRSFPKVFAKAKNDILIDIEGKKYIDLFSGAGALNYGHNNEIFKRTVLQHLENDSPVHCIDIFTNTREQFLERMNNIIFQPRNMNYKVQFTGPTGTNAVEAALKLAMINTNRSNIICFTNAYHGHTLGSLSITGNNYYRDRLRVPMLDRCFMPFDGYLGSEVNTIEIIRKMLIDKSSGVSIPAAIILESIQAEGGVNIASSEWLRELRALCDDFGIILILDEIQVGNGRTGDFFSFESANLKPDIILLSKSIGGGLPLSLLLIKPELDVWNPGEHTGTFRCNNLAIAVASSFLAYWEDDQFSHEIKAKEVFLLSKFSQFKNEQLIIDYRGRGLIWGLELSKSSRIKSLTDALFQEGLIIETAGAENNVLKILPPLTITHANLRESVMILHKVLSKFRL